MDTDYGAMARKHGDPALAPQTEHSPLNPPPILLARCGLGMDLIDRARTPYDAIVLRPTIVYGLSSSHYGALFDLANASAGILKLVADPDAIMHSCHVVDCAEAYVRLAEHPNRREVVGQAYNKSNARYETAREIGEALARSYGLAIQFTSPAATLDMSGVNGLGNFWQWVASDRIRALLGWNPRHASFVDGIGEYRLAYESSAATTP